MTARCYVLSQLRNYRQLRTRIEILQYELSCPMKPDTDEVIEAMSFHSPGSQERVSSSGVSNPTASIAASLSSQLLALNEEIEQNLYHIRLELSKAQAAASRLDYYLNKLNLEEKEVICLYYFEKVPWKEMSHHFQDCIAERTLIRLRDQALCKLTAWYEELVDMGIIDLAGCK